MNKGFTIIELVVVIAIISTLYGIILFSVSQYLNKGKDSNIYGNLSVLIPAGEVFYGGNNNSYNSNGANFCDPSTPNGNSVLRNTISQMPQNPAGDCPCADPNNCPSGSWTSTSNIAGLCCYAMDQAWAAYAREFANPSNVYCVDSRGMKEDIPSTSAPTIQSSFQCP